jgi:hypothetical protein
MLLKVIFNYSKLFHPMLVLVILIIPPKFILGGSKSFKAIICGLF